MTPQEPCYELANMWPTYRYIHTNVHKYSDFLVVLISVELAQACPNYMYENIQGLNGAFLNLKIGVYV